MAALDPARGLWATSVPGCWLGLATAGVKARGMACAHRSSSPAMNRRTTMPAGKAPTSTSSPSNSAVVAEPVKRFETLLIHEFCATSSRATGGLIHATSGSCGVEGDARVSVDVVVVLEELDAERPCVLDGAESVGERRAVLQGLEGRLGIRVVVGDVGATVTPSHPEVDHQLGHRLGAHG